MFIEHPIIMEEMKDIFHRDIEWDMLDNSRVLITGAYGMLASYIVFFLYYLCKYKKMNIQILIQGRNKDKAREKFGNLLDKDYVEYTSMDITQEFHYDNPIDYIIHAAGIANPRLYATNPVEVIEPNIIGTYNLLNYAKEHGCRGFLVFSSGDVYGKVDDPDNITEETTGLVDPLDEHSCYSESKRMQETLAVSYYREYGVPTKILRIGHTYGTTMDIKNDPRVFASFLNCVLEKRNIEMRSDGSAKRPFCYLPDAVAAYFTILFKGNNGEAYNVCNTDGFISMKELADIIILFEKQKKLKIIFGTSSDKDKCVENRANRDNNPSDKKLRKLGFQYHFSTQEGMERTYKFLKETSYEKSSLN